MNFNLTTISKILIAGIVTGIICISCEEKETAVQYQNGAFIINEGAMNGGNGTVAFYSFDSDSVYGDIFYQANNRSLGDVVQSMTISNGKAYIVVNNSNKVEIADAVTFKELGVIENITSPRYFISDGTNGYVSCWDDNSVKVIDLATNMVSSSIPVASGPEKMCIANNKLYVVNTGGWSTDSIVSVIDLSTKEVIKSIEVGYSPYDLVVDQDENIWVLCFGKVVYSPEDPYPILEETASEIFRINTTNDAIVEEHTLFEHEHPTQLEISNDGDLYFGGGYTFGGVYRFSTTDFNTTMIISDYAYGMNIDPETNEIYITLAPLYTAAGSIKIFTREGNLLGTYECGIGPNSVVF